MKSFAARSSVSAGGSVYSASGSKKKSLRKSSKQYGTSNGSGHVGSNLGQSGHSGVSPLALPSVTDSEKVEKPTSKSVSSLPPIADQTELEDVKEDSTLLDSGKSRKIDKKWESHI